MDLIEEQFIELEEVLEQCMEKHGFVRQGNKNSLKKSEKE